MAKAASFVLCSLFVLGLGCAGTPPNPTDPDQKADQSSSDTTTDATTSGPVNDKPAGPDKTAEAKVDSPPAKEDKPAPEPQEVPSKPSISCEPPAGAKPPTGKLAMTIDRAQVNLDDHRLEVKLTQPACKVELKVIGESGRTIAESAKGFSGAAAGTALVATWVPAQIEPILRIEVWGHDTHGRYVGMQITPWNVSIDHEEVNFETDSAVIRPSEEPKLQASLDKIKEIATRHKDLPNIALYIKGHTDTVGSPEHNLQLSRKRAQSIASWFRSKGLKMPISYEGFGEHSPVVKTADETAEAKNRRVDYILSLEPPRLPSGSVQFGWRGI
jgi:outer membrane protein OmpA-like peptidoglycan-associated protein